MANFIENAIDRVVMALSPRAGLRREAYRQAADIRRSGEVTQAEMERRRYQAADRGRLSSDMRVSGASGNASLAPDLAFMRARSRQMERDNPYVAAATRNLTVDLTGLDMRATHFNPRVAKKAQAAWKRYKKQIKFHVRQKVAVRETITGAEALIVWRAKGKLPNQVMDVLPGDHLDHSKTEILANGNRVILGVEYDGASSDVVAYWIFPEHPGDMLIGLTWQSERIEAQYVDHVFEEIWSRQARGVPWFYASFMTFDEIAQLETALRVKKRVEACLAVVRVPGSDTDGESDPLSKRTRDSSGRMLEELAPGMIVNARPGDKIEVVNPSSTGDGGATLRAELMKGCAGIGMPYHMVTGDVTNANFSSLRADLIPYRARREDWVYTVFAPKMVEPAFDRCMMLEAVKTGDQRYLEVEGEVSLPPMEWIDPLKDILAIKEKLRIFPGMLPEAMARLGLDWRQQIDTQAEVDTYADANKVVYDADARRVNGAGTLQAAKAGDVPASDAGAKTAEFASRVMGAIDERDAGALNNAFAEAAAAVRAGEPEADGMYAVLMALTER